MFISRLSELLSDLRFRTRALFQRNALETELDDELRAHFERHVSKLIGNGATREEAIRRARIDFGGFDQVKEECRESRGLGLTESLIRDVRFGLRITARNPGFSSIIVVTLALGIGASTAVFSVVDAILIKPLPYPNAERIVFPWRQPPPGLNLGVSELPWGRIEFQYFARETRTLEHAGAFQSGSFNLTGAGDPVRIEGLLASAGFFPSLGVPPVLGRTFTVDEDQPGHEREVVLSFRLWRNRFGQDPNVLGKTIDLNAIPYTVIGVMPADFDFPRGAEMPGSFNFPSEAELWVPLALPSGPMIPAEPSELAMVGRARAGVTLQQIQIDMDVMGRRLEDLYPQAKGWLDSSVTPLSRQVAGTSRRPLLLILAAMGVVLLITCFNVANLLISRSLGRVREFTLRAALGAGRGRLVRQLLTENLILAAFGGIGGLILATVGMGFVRAYGPANIPRLQDVGLDWRVFAFALIVSILTGLVFGVLPALGAARANLVETLKEGGQRSGASPTAARLRGALLVSQVALALVLVIAAGLLTQTFFRLFAADAGFNSEHVLTFQLSLPDSKYRNDSQIVAVHQQALDRLRSAPGIESAGIAEIAPMSGATESTGLRIPDRPAASAKERPISNYTIVSTGYFATVGTPLLRGRDFLRNDTADSMPVSIVNSAMARKFWPDQDPIGKQLGPGSSKYPMTTIVGIVADTKHFSLGEEPVPEMYVPFTQKVWPSMLNMSVVVRARTDPISVIGSVRSAIQSVDPDLPIARLMTLKAIVDDSMGQLRFSILLLGSFALLALVLACIGMYGVISYSVTHRRLEIGIRVALGAGRRSVFGMVIGHGARIAGLGIAIGLLARISHE